MSDYARPTNNVPTLLNPVVYFRVSAVALGAVAILGFIANLLDSATTSTKGFGFLSLDGNLLPFTFAHDITHLILAAAAFLFGFARLPGNFVKTFALIFGVVYTALGVLGFFALQYTATDTASNSFLALNPVLNIIHIVLGVWALTTGLVAKFPTTTNTTT